jgi:hypothetical protein
MMEHPTKRRPSTPSRRQYTSSLAGEMQQTVENRNHSGRNTPNGTAAPQSHGISKRTRSRSRRRKQSTDEGIKVDEWRSSASNGRRTPQHEATIKSSVTQSTEEMSKESSLSSAGMGGELFVSSSTPKHRLYPPPPPKVKSSTFNSSNPFGDINSNSSSSSSGHGTQQHISRNSDPIQLLKELGRKLVQETEAEGIVSDDLSMGLRSRTSRGTTLMTSSRSLPVPKQEFILGEASDIIARMDKLNIDQTTAAHHRPRKTSSSHRQQQQQQQIQRNGDANVDDVTSNAISAEKLARAALRQKEKDERKARREMLRQQQQSSGTFTLPMNDVSRGRSSDMSREDILQAAANVRARARRSASRSRERVKEAATFCGEEPSMDENDATTDDGGVDHISVSSHQRRRSILNPLGLEDQPRPPAIERRSHSREPMKIASQQSSDEKRRGRNTDQLNSLTNHVSTADELLSRRREMRDMIRERQSHTARGRSTDFDEQQQQRPTTDNWNRRENIRSSEEVRSRGRSRSVVRDGLSRIRSASSRAMHRKSTTKGDIGGDNDEVKTVNSGKSSSNFSIKSLMNIGSRHRGRSLSRDLSNGHDWESNLDRSGHGNKSSDSSVKSFFKRSLSRTRARSRDDRGSNHSLSVDSQGIAVSANKNPFLDDEYSWAAES